MSKEEKCLPLATVVSPVEIEATEVHCNIPKGRWRDNLCDCFGYCCRPVCLNTWFCSPCLLAQVMSRVGLNAVGEQTTPKLSQNTSRHVVSVLAVIYTFLTVIDRSFPKVETCVTLFDDDAFDDNMRGTASCSSTFENGTVAFLYSALKFLVGLYVLIIIFRTRNFIRKKSEIAGSDCEDCCCAYWCSCCVIGQMARHTAQYDTQSDECCSFNGLCNQSPPQVATVHATNVVV